VAAGVLSYNLQCRVSGYEDKGEFYAVEVFGLAQMGLYF